MKIAYSHIVKYIKEKPDINELSQKLFQLGHEHEIHKNIFDIEFTPNRGDCLSVRGLLRDLKLFYDTEIKLETYEKDIKEMDFDFVNNAPDMCPNISFLKIDIDRVPTLYNDQLSNYFSDLGIKKTNFFTDVSNYLSYETGQPTHCYDALKIGNHLKLDLFEDNIEFETLIEKKILLNGTNLVFLNKDNDIVNLAGVMGGKDAACNVHTKSILLECAYFHPEIILGKTVKYAITSDAAHKFERNIDPSSHNYVLRRFLKIIEEHTKINNVEIYNQSSPSTQNNEIALDYEKINKILGINLCKEDYIRYLSDLGFEIEKLILKVPPHRHDIKSLNDISEEIARAIGYDNISRLSFNIVQNEDIINTDDEKEAVIKNLLINDGFFEVINNPFDPNKTEFSIEVDNPLDTKRKFLRTNLRDSLINNYQYNERRQKDSIKLFEFSDVYSSKDDDGEKYLGVIAGGRVDKNYEDFTKIINSEYLIKLLGDYIHDKESIKVETISSHSLNSKGKNPMTYLEVRVDHINNINSKNTLTNHDMPNIQYEPISEFPSSIRDLSFSITDFSRFESFQEYILNFEDDLLKETFIFDYFYNEIKKEIKVGFRFVFQSKDATITDNEVNNIMDDIISSSLELYGVNIPGLN